MSNKKFRLFYLIIILLILGVIVYRENWFGMSRNNNKAKETIIPSQQTPTSSNSSNELEKKDLITVDSPRPNDTVKTPIVITGKARGNWYFEASFPIVLLDSNGKEVAATTAKAQSDWMTENFVPYKASLTIPSSFSGPATLVLKKDNPSGIAGHDDSLLIPITVSN